MFGYTHAEQARHDRALATATGECTCTRVHVATRDETLTCPAAWMEVPGQGWFHILPARIEAGAALRGTA
jgi:hypothetical protein